MATPRRSPGRREAGLQGCKAAGRGAGREGRLPSRVRELSSELLASPSDLEPAQAQAGLKTMRLAVRTRLAPGAIHTEAPRPQAKRGLRRGPGGSPAPGQGREQAGGFRGAPDRSTPGNRETRHLGERGLQTRTRPRTRWRPHGPPAAYSLASCNPAATGPAWSPPKQGQAGLLGSCEGISAPGEALREHLPTQPLQTQSLLSTGPTTECALNVVCAARRTCANASLCKRQAPQPHREN